jgi:hypothetical protein
MSRRLHHGIIVSSSIPSHIKEAYHEAMKVFGTGISAILYAKFNGVVSFYIPPDGSAEGWEESIAGDKRRDQYLNFLIGLRKREVWVQWVEVRWGDDDGNLPDAVTHSTYLGSDDPEGNSHGG